MNNKRVLGVLIILVIAIVVISSTLTYAYFKELAIAKNEGKTVDSLDGNISSLQKALSNESHSNVQLMATISGLKSMLNAENGTLYGYKNQIDNLQNLSLSLNASIASIEIQLSDKNATISNLTTEINIINSQLIKLELDVLKLNGQISNLKSILSLNNSTIVVKNNYDVLEQWIFNFSYQGYIKFVEVSSLGGNVTVSWVYHNITYNISKSLSGGNTTSYFLIMPNTNIYVTYRGYALDNLVIAENTTIIFYF